jgi:hypothetical protein
MAARRGHRGGRHRVGRHTPARVQVCRTERARPTTRPWRHSSRDVRIGLRSQAPHPRASADRTAGWLRGGVPPLQAPGSITSPALALLCRSSLIAELGMGYRGSLLRSIFFAVFLAPLASGNDRQSSWVRAWRRVGGLAAFALHNHWRTSRAFSPLRSPGTASMARGS